MTSQRADFVLSQLLGRPLIDGLSALSSFSFRLACGSHSSSGSFAERRWVLIELRLLLFRVGSKQRSDAVINWPGIMVRQTEMISALPA